MESKGKKVTLPLRFGTKIKKAIGVDIVINQKVIFFQDQNQRCYVSSNFYSFLFIQLWGGI